MKTDNTELFTQTPVPRAVLALVIPTVISQIITVVYNMADCCAMLTGIILFIPFWKKLRLAENDFSS